MISELCEHKETSTKIIADLKNQLKVAKNYKIELSASLAKIDKLESEYSSISCKLSAAEVQLRTKNKEIEELVLQLVDTNITAERENDNLRSRLMEILKGQEQTIEELSSIFVNWK